MAVCVGCAEELYHYTPDTRCQRPDEGHVLLEGKSTVDQNISVFQMVMLESF